MKEAALGRPPSFSPSVNKVREERKDIRFWTSEQDLTVDYCVGDLSVDRDRRTKKPAMSTNPAIPANGDP